MKKIDEFLKKYNKYNKIDFYLYVKTINIKEILNENRNK